MTPERRRVGHRRQARGAALLVVAALAACSGGSDDEGPSTAGSGDTGTSARSEAVDLGDRVVVLGEEDLLADVLALGVEPVAASATVPEAGFQGIDDDTSGIEVLPMTTLSLEDLAAEGPSAIITLQFWVDQVDRSTLEGMADLIIVPDGLDSAEQITDLGERLGREEEAADIVADLDAAETAAAEGVPDDCEVSIAAIYPGPAPAAFVEGPWVIPTSFLDAGCTLVPDASEVEPDGNGRVYLSLEQLGLLSAPTLVLTQSSSVEGDDEALSEIEESPLWAQLPAVQSGSVVELDRLGYPGATGHIRLLGELPDLV